MFRHPCLSLWLLWPPATWELCAATWPLLFWDHIIPMAIKALWCAPPVISPGLQRTATTELLSGAVSLLPVHSEWPWCKWWPLGPPVKYNYLVGFLASYNISRPTFSLLSASLFLLLFCTMINQAPRLHSALITTFSKLLGATLAASLSHSLWFLTGVKCRAPRKYTQINNYHFSSLTF